MPQPVAATMAVIAGQSQITSTNAAHHAMIAKVRTLIRSPDVVGFAFGKKVIGGEVSNDMAIIFHVRRKITLQEIEPNMLLPEILVDPKGRAILTDIVQVGEVEAHANIASDPVKGGFSVSHMDGSPGTLAALVGKGKVVCLLSAQHVLTNFDRGVSGDAIHFPGRSDGGGPGDRIASLLPFTPLAIGANYPNLIDAALAQLAPGFTKALDLGTLGAVPPLETGDAQIGQQVMMVGRTTTAPVQAKITSLNAYADLYYPGLGYVGFQKQIICDPLGKLGDSGALVLSAASRKVIGVHIGGSPEVSYVTPIRTVLATLGARFLKPS